MAGRNQFAEFRIAYIQLTILLIALALQSCWSPSTPRDARLKPTYVTDNFKSYWYSGKAEINVFKLDQSRYGENRDGKAILIFVSEDFSMKKHVKMDNPDADLADKVNVLKMNFAKNFVTGIYPYSMMLSVFSAVNQNPHPLKVTMSSQEWCGHVFSQLDLDQEKYIVHTHSYFENDRDEQVSLKAAWLEDELWNLIRLDPEKLPLGQIEIIPGLFFTRLNHVSNQVTKATSGKEKRGDDIQYTVNFNDGERILAITYQKDFPHKIYSWDEYLQVKGRKLHTVATLEKTLITDYWRKNSNEFLYLRDSLGLSSHNY